MNVVPPRIAAIQPVLMSRDVARSLEFYQRLGFEVAFVDDPDAPRYAGVRRDGIELHLQWHDPREWEGGGDRPTCRFVVDAIDQLHREFVAAGVRDLRDPFSTSWGTREFHVRDPDLNGLQFYHDAPPARLDDTSTSD